MAKRKSRSLRFIYVFWLSFLGGAFLLLSLGIVALAVSFGRTREYGFLIALIAFTIVSLTGLAVIAVLFGRKLHKNYVEALMGVTMANYQKINIGNSQLEDYPEDDVTEFITLNEEVQNVRTSLTNATFIYGELNYEPFGFVPVEGLEDVYELEGFQKQLTNVVATSMNFRNVLAEVYYELSDDDELEEKEIKALVASLKQRLSSYPGVLYLLPKKRRSMYVYLPRIESFSALEDHFNALVSSCSISKHRLEGFVSLLPHYCIVAYPFSAVHEMFPDLRYARRQGKIAHLYLPNRAHSLGQSNIGRNAMHLNQMSRILYNLSSIEATSSNKQAVRKGVAGALEALCSELRFEMAGIVVFDPEVDGYVIKDHVGDKSLLDEGKHVDNEFIEALSSSVDADHSFFFSCREKAGRGLGKLADRLGIESGFLYLLQKEGLPHGAIYFFSHQKILKMDSYLQEAIGAACYHIASSYAYGEVLEESLEATRQFEALLTSADSAFYRVEKGSHKLIGFSRGLRHTFPHIKEGQPCYQCIYGLEEPCPDCPLTAGKKKLSNVKKHQYATSLTLDVRRGAVHTLLIQRLKTSELDTNRYDNELLVSSFPTLLSETRSHFLVGDNGYVLVLRVANHAQLLAEFGSEGFLLILRNFIDAMRKTAPQYDNLYRYDEKSLALLLPAVGQVDVINRCEEIYRLTKNIVFEGDKKYSLDIDYLPMNYPQGYAGAEDFFRHVSRDMTSRKLSQGHDFIYFDDTDYVRPASRRDFMLSVIEEQFGKETFRVELQPMVEGKTRKVFGAEILLRIQDEYRHIVFNPVELVRVAAENGKIPLITRALLRYVASFYESVGPATFRATGFRRLALNTDVSLFTDPTFEEDFAALLKRANLPQDFIAFEIAEGDVAHNLEAFAAATKMLKKFNIQLVVDQYSGRNLNIDDLARLGFDKVKVGRNVVHNIDTDQAKLGAITSLLNEAKEKGIETAIVGVENRDQYDLLMKINPNVEMQGYYFYKPLERTALLDAMRSNKNLK